jgi:hypothetical protein
VYNERITVITKRLFCGDRPRKFNATRALETSTKPMPDKHRLQLKRRKRLCNRVQTVKYTKAMGVK